MAEHHRKIRSNWNGDDLKYWAKRVGCQTLSQLAPMIKRSTNTVHAYSSGHVPIPLEVEEAVTRIYQAQCRAKLDEADAHVAGALYAKATAEIVPPPPRQQGPGAMSFRLLGYYAKGGVKIPPNEREYPPKWLTVAQAEVLREALKYWAIECHARYKVLTHEQHQREHRLELLNIKNIVLCMPKPDHITQPWVFKVCEWPVIGRALRNYYHATNTIHAYSLYQTIRRNLNVSKKLCLGSTPRRLRESRSARDGGDGEKADHVNTGAALPRSEGLPDGPTQAVASEAPAA